MVKGIKKIIGALLIFVFGIFCLSSFICFGLTLIGKLEVESVGQYLFSLLMFLMFLCTSGVMVCIGGCFWKNRPLRTIFRKPVEQEEARTTCTVENSEFEAVLDEEMEKNLKGFLMEDKAPFAAYPIEKAYYDELRNHTEIQKFYLVSEGVLVKDAIRQYQKCLEERMRYKKHVSSVPKNVQIRISSEKALKGCDETIYEQCCKDNIRLAIYTGPYTLRDLTKNKEYTVVIENINRMIAPSYIRGIWSLKS